MSPVQSTAETPRDQPIPQTAYPFGEFALGTVLGVRRISTPQGERGRPIAN